MIIKQRKAAGVIGTMDLVGHVKVPPPTHTHSFPLLRRLAWADAGWGGRTVTASSWTT